MVKRVLGALWENKCCFFDGICALLDRHLGQHTHTRSVHIAVLYVCYAADHEMTKSSYIISVA